MDLDLDKSSPWVASAVGALLGLRVFPGASWPERAMNGTIMFGAGIILGGGLVEYLGLTRGMVVASVVLLTSALSLVLFQVVVEAIRASQLGITLRDKVRKVFGLDPLPPKGEQ